MDVFLINMVPKSLSGDTGQDSEANLAVDPQNPRHIAATAFTSDPLGGPLAPIYVSSDGGHSWALNLLAPGGSSTSDITVHFGTQSHVLYAGILRQDDLDLNVLRTANFLGPGPMTILEDRPNEDQPWVEAITDPSVAGSPDRVYVGNNNFNTSPQTATIDLSQNAATAPPPAGVAPQSISSRTPGSQNAPPTRPVAHPDGTVYAAYVDWQNAYFGNGNYTCDVIVCRDDDWGLGATPFTALVDPGDLLAGVRVGSSVTIPWQNGVNFIGQERGGVHVAISVAPKDSATVYLAWVDYPGGSPPLTLHVRRSTDRGNTWSADLRTIDNCINPALAIDERGRVGLLYQTLTQVGATWETIVEISDDGFSGSWSTFVLTSAPSNAPARVFYPYLGDYTRLQSVGENFYGVFCANNTPDLANFPNGVVFQRNADFSTKTLLNVDDITPVAISIDPFFFKVTVKPARLVTSIAAGGAFGDACLGSFSDEILTLDNAGSGTLSISSITSSSPEFLVPEVLGYPIEIAPGAAMDVVVRFAPSALGLQHGTLTIVSNEPASPHKISLTGVGTAPRLSLVLANHGNFGTACVGKFADEVLTANNSGKCMLMITSIVSSTPDFIVPEAAAFPLAVAPGSSLQLPIRYAPSTYGPSSGMITIHSNDPSGPKSIAVSGDAASGKVTITGSNVFGGIHSCRREQRIINICNTGACDLHVHDVHFKHRRRCYRLIDNPFPATIRPGAFLSVVVGYKAEERISRGAELVIDSDDPHHPVKHVELFAYTIWDCCPCKDGCNTGCACACHRCPPAEGDDDDC